MLRILAVMLMAGVVGGCSTSLSSKTDFPMEEVARLVPGTTTKADVVAKLGKPLAVDPIRFPDAPTTGEMWTYSQTASSMSGVVIKTMKINQKSAFVSFRGDSLLTATWQVTNTETDAGGGGKRISEAEIQKLKEQGTVTQDVVRRAFGEPQQKIWNLDGTQQWGYIAVGFLGTDLKFNRFDFDPDGSLNKVAILDK
jgi:outer membrane protein assembly factor BamE (lipoprotein component of BamABCDE complex)